MIALLRRPASWSHLTTTILATITLTSFAFLPQLFAAEPNAQMKMVLDTYASLNAVPLEKSTPEAVRKAPSLADAVKAVMKKEGKSAPFTGTTQDIKVPTAGGELAARVYIPAGDGPFPTIYYIHGGGWVIADIDIYDSSPRALCEKTKAVVISTEYRKAPEHKYPAAHDDTWAVYQWVLQNAAKYKGDPKKVAIVGESAGGNMAASICIMAKQKGVQMPVHQLLIYPVTDYSFETKSYKENAESKPLSAAGMKWFFKYYLTKAEDGNDPRLSILRTKDLSGLPAATIINAEIDPLRDEGEAYGEKLKAAGVPVTHKLYLAVAHEFFGMGAVIDEAEQAETFAAEQLKTAFSK